MRTYPPVLISASIKQKLTVTIKLRHSLRRHGTPIETEKEAVTSMNNGPSDKSDSNDRMVENSGEDGEHAEVQRFLFCTFMTADFE